MNTEAVDESCSSCGCVEADQRVRIEISRNDNGSLSVECDERGISGSELATVFDDDRFEDVAVRQVGAGQCDGATSTVRERRDR